MLEVIESQIWTRGEIALRIASVYMKEEWFRSN